MTHPVLHQYDLGLGVKAFSSTRHGGVGKGRYASFNINFYCGDNDADVDANRASLCQMLGIDVWHLVYPHQVHGDVVAALRLNAYLLVGLPLLGIYAVAEWQRTRWPRFYVALSSPRVLCAIVLTVLLWWVLRNLLGC